ncbi:MAG: ammonia-forming cytochrome c nitrite reductase subunit c552, partial [Verrucomicrobiae bacterium]|nr:ammonia-forming cytochrome c nitrite reductase subunit c552 [Verrucomicrobiae bacterium]
ETAHGVAIKVVTGDNDLVARKICKEVGLSTEFVLLGSDVEAMNDEQLAEARRLQRKAQYRVDFVNAENSMGFHAPQEAARILAEAIDYAQQGRLAVAQIRPAQQAAWQKEE